MTLGNMRELKVRYQVAFCHNDACRHQAVIDVATRPRHRCFGSAARPHAASAAASGRSAAELERVSNAAETQQGKHLKQIPVKAVHNLHAENTPYIGLFGGS
jgi:hypothetical protein